MQYFSFLLKYDVSIQNCRISSQYSQSHISQPTRLLIQRKSDTDEQGTNQAHTTERTTLFTEKTQTVNLSGWHNNTLRTEVSAKTHKILYSLRLLNLHWLARIMSHYTIQESSSFGNFHFHINSNNSITKLIFCEANTNTGELANVS